MNTRVNPPYPQPGPVLFAVACVVGSAFAIRGLLTLPIGTEPWLVAAVAQLIILGGFAFIELGWLWIQREVDISDGSIVVRRWIEVVRGRPGRAIPLGDRTRTSITLENVCSFQVEHDSVVEARITLGYWELHRIRELVDALRANRVPLAQYWDGEYPPGVA